MRFLRRFRLFVARRPLVYWLLVGTFAALAASVVVARTSAADAARRSWGDARAVLVATRDLAPGQVLGDGDTRVERWPVALVPVGVLEELGEGTIVSAPIGAGEPIVLRRLGRAGVGPVASLLPPGTRGVTLPTGDTPLPVRPGDHVDVVAADGAGSGQIVASAALVVRSDERAVVVAVDVAELGAVAGALAGGTVVLAVSGDPPAS
jgi:Flp pilus assembly protein CpaB